MNTFKKTTLAMTSGLLLLIAPLQTFAAYEELTYFTEKEDGLAVELIARYTSGAETDEGGTEIIVYDAKSHQAFSVNGAEKAIDILDLSVLSDGQTTTIPLKKRIPLADIGVEAGDVTSVAIHPSGDYIAITAPAPIKTDNGHVVFLDTDGKSLANVEVGALPDMVTFSPDGTKALVANEGEPSDDYTINPHGSVSIIDLSGDISELDQSTVTTVDFSNVTIPDDIRKVHPDSTYAEDLEPEYIVVDGASQYAYVAIQEDNAIAKLDINAKQFVAIKSLGYKDFSTGENMLDASNKDDGINIQNWPVLSIYQPDGMAMFEANGKSYILTANEGDAQDWEGFSEESRVKDIAEEIGYELNADLYEGYTQEQLDDMVANGLYDDEQLGRLTSSTSHPKNENGKYEAIYGFGARSFSIWDTDSLGQVYDSGAQFEQKMAAIYPDFFNTNNDEDGFDSRSDDKGPEPESVITGNVQDKDYAFIGLERQGGIMVYDLSNPIAPTFDSYFASRAFHGEDVSSESGDSAPEGLTFITAEESPTDQALLLAAHEVTGTIAVYALGEAVSVEEPGDEEAPGNEDGVDDGQDDSDKEPETPGDEDDSENPDDNQEDNPAPGNDNDNPTNDSEENKDKEEDSTDQYKDKDSDQNESDSKDNAEKSKDGDNKLPNTATGMWNTLIIGSLLLLTGLSLVVRKRIHS
ncbi:choice-of-anchor I family protein [Aquibacillus koreensis]|uniref:Choice-of-anchor I family protein n=1 Tax=Aquibacillus koreensis TaxID=279446 RepID=A0A9X3WJX0_9BACI|nr:choice-of-anchor I family protein [Aquibacillus koreensis]MCT2537047.1 choice-of-anchor I family protein [Aquibacillus koreensis]MDC3419970.1 choice-of-anchor I family protein [Aquibacillus koreensis]